MAIMFVAMSFITICATTLYQNQDKPLTMKDGSSKKDDRKKDESKTSTAKECCRIIFNDGEKGIYSGTPKQLILESNGDVRPVGVRIQPLIKKDDIAKYVLADSENLFPDKPIEVTLLVNESVTINTLKKFAYNLSATLPEKKSVLIYIDVNNR